MPITEATIRQVKYFPELLPDSRIVSVLMGQEAAPSVLELRRFNRFLRLVDISVEQNANAVIRLRNDQEREEISCAALPNLLPADWDVIATEFLYLNLYGLANLTDFRISFGLWVWEPTVADLIKMKKSLTPEQNELAQKLGLRDTVEKGLLPLPISYQIQREYQLIDRKTFTYAGQVTPIEAIIRTLPTKPGEVLILESIGGIPGTVSDNIRIRVDRDNDSNYVEVYTYALPTTGVRCWIPALNELKLKVVANTTTSVAVVYTVGRYLLTNTLRVRFGLMSKSEVPGDLWDKVKGGVL